MSGWARRTGLVLLALAVNALLFGTIPYLTQVQDQRLRSRQHHDPPQVHHQVTLEPEPADPAPDASSKPQETPSPAAAPSPAPQMPEAAPSPRPQTQSSPRIQRPALDLPAPQWEPSAITLPKPSPSERGPKSPGSGSPIEAPALDRQPRLVSHLRPVYPYKARRQGLNGTVVVEVLVSAKGRVAKARVVRATPENVFEDSALKAVRQWRFAPATANGKPVRARVRIPIRFSLENQNP